jgi:DNA invertase Pin-like site-specific DNA recombinase
MRAFGYLRISKESPDTTSPRRQREAIEQLCAARGWDLVEMHSDVDVSAYNGHRRPAFDGMMARLADVDAIVFWRLDRLARSVRQLEDIADACQKADVQLVSTDGEIDTTSAAGRAFYQMRGVFGEFESRNLSERSRQMMAHKRTRGEWVGRAPFGWKVVEKMLVPDNDQQAVLLEAARRYVAGDSFSAIARDLGFQTGPLSRMLRSERVQEAIPDDLSGPLASALVERRFQRVPTSSQSLLGGIATCGFCGKGMTMSSTRAGRQGRWSQYRCPVAGHTGISAPWLDDHVVTKVTAAIDTGEIVKALRRRRKPGRSRKASEIEARMDFIDEQLAAGSITQARYDRMNAALVDQLATANQAERDAGIDLPVELARNLGTNFPTFTLVNKRRVIQAVFERIEVSKASGHGAVDDRRVKLLPR